MEHSENINEKSTESLGINDDFNFKVGKKTANIVKNDGHEMEITQTTEKEQISKLQSEYLAIRTNQTRRNLDGIYVNSKNREKRRITYKYKKNDKILVKNSKRTSKFEPLFIGPYSISKTSEDNQRVLIEENEIKVWNNM